LKHPEVGETLPKWMFIAGKVIYKKEINRDIKGEIMI
jgi:hypothetical protein